MAEMAERKLFRPQPFVPRERERLGPLPLMFPAPVAGPGGGAQAGLENASTYAARNYVLEDLDVAQGRRRCMCYMHIHAFHAYACRCRCMGMHMGCACACRGGGVGRVSGAWTA